MADPEIISRLTGPGISLASAVAIISFLVKWTSGLRKDMQANSKEAREETEHKIDIHSRQKDEERKLLEAYIKSRFERNSDKIAKLDTNKLDGEKHALICRTAQLETAAVIQNSLMPISEAMRKQETCISDIRNSLVKQNERLTEITKKWIKTVVPGDQE